MSKHILASVIGFFVLLFFCESCKKAIPPNGKIKGVTYRHQFSDTTIIDTISYSYDQQGRAESIQHINGKETYVFGAISYTYIPISGPSITGILNDHGLVTNTSNGDAYSYDQQGYLASWIGTGFSYYYTISNGNIVTDSEVNNGNSSMQVYTYSSIVDYRDFGKSFEGKQSHNLGVIASLAGDTSITSYTFDSKGRVSTETISGNKILFTNTYSYYD